MKTVMKESEFLSYCVVPTTWLITAAPVIHSRDPIAAQIKRFSVAVFSRYSK